MNDETLLVIGQETTCHYRNLEFMLFLIFVKIVSCNYQSAVPAKSQAAIAKTSRAWLGAV
jgi:hypothetical protein